MAKFFQESKIVHPSENISSGALAPTNGLPAVALFVIGRRFRRQIRKRAVIRNEKMHVPRTLAKTEQDHTVAMPFQCATAAKAEVIQAGRNVHAGLGINCGKPFIKLP